VLGDFWVCVGSDFCGFEFVDVGGVGVRDEAASSSTVMTSPLLNNEDI